MILRGPYYLFLALDGRFSVVVSFPLGHTVVVYRTERR